MRTRIFIVLIGLLVVLAIPALAQQPVKRSEVELLPVGPSAKELTPKTWRLYDFHTAMEIGGQFADRHGSLEIYRSQVNYTSGGRLFGFNFEGKAHDPNALFTRMYMQAGGWGGDPYNWLRYGLSKDRWFDFRADYLRSDYFFLIPGWVRNQHRNDQQRRRQNYDFTLFPQRKVRFRLGYSRNSSFGPTLTTFDFSRDEFAMFEPLRQTYDEYKIGADWNIQRWSFFFDYSWRHFRNDRFLEVVTPPVPNPGNNVPPPASNTTSLNIADRFYPGRGHIPFVRFTVAGRPHRTLDVSARILYSRAKFDFTRFEFDNGRTFDPSGAPPAVVITSLFNSVGSTIRPNTVADLSVNWRPVSKLSISDTFRFNGFDIAGGDLTNIATGCSAATDPAACLSGSSAENLINLFDIDYFVNRFEIRYDPVRWLGLRAGERHAHRDTRLVHTTFDCAGASLPGCTGGTLTFDEEIEPATRVTNTLLLGGDFRPHRTFSLFVDYERGGIDSVFNRIRRGHRVTARVRARWEPTQGMRFNASWVQFDLRAPSPDVDSNQHNRGFSLDFGLTRWQRYYWDIGYSRNDVNSFTEIGRRTGTGFLLVDGPAGIDCTLSGGVWLRSVTLGLPCRPSTYIDNNNYAYFDLGGRIVGNLHGEVGYRVFSATGAYAPSDPEGACPLIFFGPCTAYPSLLPTFPVIRVEWGGFNLHEPHTMLQYVFNDNVSLKAGWRWYGYNVKRGSLSDYKAHIATLSLMLSF